MAGTSGSGKTTLARRVGEVLDIPHVDIDGLFHGPNWVPRESFVDDVEAFTSQPSWATEWQYSSVRGLLADRADLVLWLDLPRSTVMRQVIGRTLRRRLRRVELWNGNYEPPLSAFFTDPDHIVRWAWRTHHKTALRIASLRERRPELAVVRLPSRAAVARWRDGPLLAATEERPAPAGPASS
ncbi:AAA family ATPase [Pseudofrankia sp. DC12]|uniref:AAA family ATPase n=1 Tax=Pseudofrankia sp. DC12 TaxID=683315 RepID=UPI001E447901|nr:AAA family ATPase [Pseudofrankia sp. DC12]